MTDLRDQLKASLSSTAQQAEERKGPSASEMAEQVKALKAANTIEATPQRARQAHSTAEIPITARIRRRQEEAASADEAGSPEVPSPESKAMTFQERILRERQENGEGQSPP